MKKEEIALIAQQVSVLLQLDRTRHSVSSQLDMSVLANVPAYLSSVFEQANQIDPTLSAADIYTLINKRVSEVQAQVYLLRLELENRDPNDPASIYADPMVVSAYGERLDTLISTPKTFTFGPEILASGWHPVEISDDKFYRWMRPGATAIACVPHLGAFDQTLEIKGYVQFAEQMDGLTISAFGKIGKFSVAPLDGMATFTLTLPLASKDLEITNYVPVDFSIENYMSPSPEDTRLLGANIQSFTLTPGTVE